MTMKMNTTELRKDGKCVNISIGVNILLIVVYLIDTIFIFPTTTINVLSLLPPKPDFLVVVKCSYAILMIVGLFLVKKESNSSWFLLNMASVGVLSLWIFSFLFYTSIIDSFLLELSAIWLLIMTNVKPFIKKYKAKRTLVKTILLFIIPIIILVLIILRI